MGYTTRDTHIHKGDNGEKNTSVQLDIVIRRRVIVQQRARDRYRDDDDDVFGADHFGSDSAVVGGPICRGRDGRGSDTRGTGQPDVVEPGPGCAALYPGGPSVRIWVWVHHHDHAVVPRWTTRWSGRWLASGTSLILPTGSAGRGGSSTRGRPRSLWSSLRPTRGSRRLWRSST